MEGVVDMTADQRVLDLSVIIPALNEGASIGDLVARVNKRLLVLGVRFEIVVVDDGSTDGTAVCLQPYANRIRYMYQTNAGSAAARAPRSSSPRR